MSKRFYNGLQVDVPEDWADLSTVILAPSADRAKGERPSINLVVKRRKAVELSAEAAIREYLRFVKKTFEDVSEMVTREMTFGGIKGTAVRFSAVAEGEPFRQTTVFYRLGDEEVSATVTQLSSDETPEAEIDRMLASVRPVGGSMAGNARKEAQKKATTKRKRAIV